MFPEERRLHPRFPFHSKSELHMPFMAYSGALIDISLFGALFEAGLFHLNIAAGENCRLEILHLNGNPAFAIEGVIAHTNNNLIGIEFTALDKKHLNQLRHICTLNLALPNVLNRKLPALFQEWRT